MKITINDIAKRTNLSIATVSRALNNSAKVSAKTRQRIEDTIKEMSLQPNSASWGILRRRLKTVGLVLPDITNAFYPPVIRGIEDELFRNDYNVFLCNTDESIDQEMQYIQTLLEKGVDAIIFLGTRPTHNRNDHLVRLSESIPVLMINDSLIGSNVYSVMSDEVEGAYKAVKYLLELGHTRIAFVNGNVEYTTYRYKQLGFEQALRDHCVPILGDYVVKEDPHETGGYKGARKLITGSHPPTAIFCASDQIAVGAIKAIYEQHRSIPGDFSVIGFSDSPIAEHLFPGLTTISQSPYKTGQISAQTIIKVIRKEKLDQRKIILDTQLVIRQSCRKLS